MKLEGHKGPCAGTQHQIESNLGQTDVGPSYNLPTMPRNVHAKKILELNSRKKLLEFI